jgi:sarcosine oxidase subunit gamma
MVDLAVRQAPAVPSTPWLRPLPAATRFSFFGDARAQALAEVTWQVPFSARALRAKVRDRRASLWVGPDEYLLIALGEDNAAELAASLALALVDLPHSLVDISHRQIALEVRGPHAEAILNGGCPLDLDIAKFPVGMCTRTVFAKAEIVLWRTAPDVFHVEVWRSFADYLTALLVEIARDY